jgi:hypothetical protein
MAGFVNSALIKVQVGEGEDATDLFVHEDRIVARSKFFKCALRNVWDTGRNKTVKLDDINPVEFAAYLELVYTDKIPYGVRLGVDELGTIEFEDGSQYTCSFYCYAALYVIAERMEDRISRNLLVKAMVAHSQRRRNRPSIPSFSVVKMIYEGTGSSLNFARQLMVDMYLNKANPEFPFNEDFPREFICDFASSSLVANRSKTFGHEIVAEEYLEGGEEEEQDVSSSDGWSETEAEADST